jgi:hypothetical protein
MNRETAIIFGLAAPILEQSLSVPLTVVRSVEAVAILTFNPELVDAGQNSSFAISNAREAFPRTLLANLESNIAFILSFLLSICTLRLIKYEK